MAKPLTVEQAQNILRGHGLEVSFKSDIGNIRHNLASQLSPEDLIALDTLQQSTGWETVLTRQTYKPRTTRRPQHSGIRVPYAGPMTPSRPKK